MLSPLFSQYPTFLVFLAVFVAMILTLVFMPPFIRFLKAGQIGQQVRDDGPETHLVKQGTPTMGGVIMLIACAATVLIVGLPNAETFVAMDLLASARALLGHKAGFAAILGTGTNSCLYDGERITLNIDSLGFILGDEGSGAYMGKRMLVDYVRGRVSDAARRVIEAAVPYHGDEIIDIIYTKPFPNRFCGQYGKLIHDNLSIPYFHDLAEDSFCQLFEQIISLYPDYRSYAFNCVGSVGWYFQDILKPVVRRYGMEVGTLLRTPMEGLIHYHQED